MDRNSLLKAVWGLSKQLGIDKEELYILLDRETGKNSMRQCSEVELKKLLKALDFFKAKDELQKSGPTNPQLKFIRDLNKQIDWKKENGGLNAFLHKHYSVDSEQWLTSEQASKVIEALKNMAKSSKKKKGAVV